MKKYIIGFLTAVGLLAGGLVYANQTQFSYFAQTATATGTISYLYNATSTLTLDSYNNGVNFKTDRAILLVQATASTTAPVIRARVEYSFDNVDWYPGTVQTSTTGTTTVLTGVFADYQFNLATSTNGDFGGSGTASRVHQSLIIEMPARYVRVKLTQPGGSSAVGVYAELRPWREIHD